MSTIKSSAENLTLNADGSGNDIKFQSNGVEKASIDQDGVLAAGGATLTGQIAIDQNSNVRALTIDSESTSESGIVIDASVLTTGRAAHFYSNAPSSSTRDLVHVENVHASSTGTTAFKVTQNSTGLAADFVGDKIRVADGILFGTDTAAANALDDYEEGTFTPSLTFGGGAVSMAYSSQDGSYVKVGTMCYISLRITLSSKGSSTGAATIIGLPFTSANVAGNFSKGGMAFANNWYGSVAGTQHHIHTNDGNTSAISMRRLDDGGNWATFTNDHMDDNVDMIISMTMRTA